MMTHVASTIEPRTPPRVFDDSHYAPTVLQKVARCFQLGPKYYALDLPRYFRSRRALHLSPWDVAALINPLREFRRRPFVQFPLPPHYEDALEQLAENHVRLTIPRLRLEALLGLWWTTRAVPGPVIECGSYRGATALLIALLGKLNGLKQTTFMLDTFAGMPRPSRHDFSRTAGEFVPGQEQVTRIRQQAAALGIEDRIEVYQGLFAETFALLRQRPLQFAFVHIDANIYQGTLEACTFGMPRLADGGAVVFDDYNGVCDLGARLAIDQYLAGTTLKPQPLAASSAYLFIPGSMA
jgi:hypothetical protein